MNALTTKKDEAILKAINGVSGFVTNDFIRLRIKDEDWPNVDSLKPPSIGRAMSRLGYKSWRNKLQRGWLIE